MDTHEGRILFQGIQKILSIFFIIFEAIIYIFMGGLSPTAGMSPWVLVFQLFLGGMLILYMDEVMHKWGFGSGVSLFIAAGVSAEIIIKALSPLTTTGAIAFGTGQAPIGKVFVFFYSLVQGNPTEALLAISAILFTVVVFAISVYAQAMKVEIPLSFGRVRGYGVRWPLNFFYTSNIPVILVAALIANVQLFGSMLSKAGIYVLGHFQGSTPVSGLASWLYGPQIIRSIITSSIQFADVWHTLVYILFMMLGAMVFSLFWVQTSGLDARSQAKQMLSSGLQIPGFRKDIRVLERMLNRYIMPLTVIGGLAVGLLAALADVSGALTSGTGLLLTVMIVHKLYEEIAQQHMMDINPMMRKFIST